MKLFHNYSPPGHDRQSRALRNQKNAAAHNPQNASPGSTNRTDNS